MKIQPLRDQVLILRAQEEEKTRGGLLYIPSTAQTKSVEGTVLKVGPGKLLENGELRPMSVKEGDKVLFEKYGDREIEVDGQKFVLISEDNISAVLEN
jgi:chaperonin GroES